MLSPDTIRRAVEIADGFHGDSFTFQIGRFPHADLITLNENPAQWMLDALAAQLVRQVDALNFVGIAFDAYGTPFATDIFPDKGESIQADGPDRIANTINAIVQFDKDNPGVLK